MKKNYTAKKVLQAFLLIFITVTANLSAQVGIGTTTPHASSVLDVASTTQGMLTPRMTTAQRVAIVSPADGLIVYDTELKSFYHYNSTAVSWNKMSSAADSRLKFKRIKSTDVLATVLAAEKTAGGGSKYLLDATTLYEINGTIMVDLPIDLNGAYVAGLDSGEDKLVKLSGDLFTGTSGGSIRVVTLVASGTGGKVFNIAGNGTQNLILRDCVIANSANVGLIKGFSLVFVSIIQYAGNANGIVYENIEKLLINNAGWFGGALPLGNSGTYEKIVGTFGQVAKQGGFSEVTGTSIGFDVSSNPTITGDGNVDSVLFTGTVSGAGVYVKPYTIGTYIGYNFNNSWSVRCPGIQTEGDAVATGDINFDFAVGSGSSTTFSGSGVKTKVAGVTTSNNLLRFSIDASNNRLKYLGKKKRYFNATGSLSFQSSADATTYILYIAKNGVVVGQSKVYSRSSSTNDILAIPLVGIIELATNDYIEVWAERFSGAGNMLTVSMNLVID